MFASTGNACSSPVGVHKRMKLRSLSLLGLRSVRSISRNSINKLPAANCIRFLAVQGNPLGDQQGRRLVEKVTKDKRGFKCPSAMPGK